MPVSIKCEYLGGRVSISGGVGDRDRRIELGLGLSSIVDSLEALDLNQDLLRALGSKISSWQDKRGPIFIVQVFHLDRTELDWLDILSSAEDEFLRSGGSEGSGARYW